MIQRTYIYLLHIQEISSVSSVSCTYFTFQEAYLTYEHRHAYVRQTKNLRWNGMVKGKISFSESWVSEWVTGWLTECLQNIFSKIIEQIFVMNLLFFRLHIFHISHNMNITNGKKNGKMKKKYGKTERAEKFLILYSTFFHTELMIFFIKLGLCIYKYIMCTFIVFFWRKISAWLYRFSAYTHYVHIYVYDISHSYPSPYNRPYHYVTSLFREIILPSFSIFIFFSGLMLCALCLVFIWKDYIV